MGSTSRGITYPETADNISDLVADIQALASTANTAIVNSEGGTVEGYKLRGEIPAGTDLNTLVGDADAGVWSSGSNSNVATLLNVPTGVTFSFSLEVISQPSGITAHRLIPYNLEFNIWNRVTNNTSGTSWQAWKKTLLDDGSFVAFQKAPLATGTDLSALSGTGYHPINTGTVAASLVSDVTPNPGPGGVIHLQNTNGVVTQFRTAYAAGNGVWFRSRLSTSGGYGSWSSLMGGGSSSTSTADSGPYRHEDLLVRAVHRRGGAIGTGKATVALRFDHHLNNFQSIILPLLIKYNLPWTQVVNPDRVGVYSTDSDVTYAELQDMALNYGGEIWNHGANHGDATTETALDEQIVNSLANLQTNLPELAIEGWAPPGLAAGGYMGAAPFATTEQNTATYAGRKIIGRHAFVAGYSDELYRVLDGNAPIGATHWTIDQASPASIATHLSNAQERGAGFALMLHPNFVDTAGYITSADVEAIFADVAARRDAGTVEVVSYAGLWISDSRSTYRHDIAPVSARNTSTAIAAAGSSSVIISTYGRGIQLGASKEIRVRLTASGAGSVDVAVTGKPTTTYTVASGANTLRKVITLGLTSGNVNVTITPTVGVTLNGVNCYAI